METEEDKTSLENAIKICQKFRSEKPDEAFAMIAEMEEFLRQNNPDEYRRALVTAIKIAKEDLNKSLYEHDGTDYGTGLPQGVLELLPGKIQMQKNALDILEDKLRKEKEIGGEKKKNGQ